MFFVIEETSLINVILKVCNFVIIKIWVILFLFLKSRITDRLLKIAFRFTSALAWSLFISKILFMQFFKHFNINKMFVIQNKAFDHFSMFCFSLLNSLFCLTSITHILIEMVYSIWRIMLLFWFILHTL